MNKGGVSLHDVAIGIRNKLITDADLLSIAADASAKKRAKAKVMPLYLSLLHSLTNHRCSRPALVHLQTYNLLHANST